MVELSRKQVGAGLEFATHELSRRRARQQRPAIDLPLSKKMWAYPTSIDEFGEKK